MLGGVGDDDLGQVVRELGVLVGGREHQHGYLLGPRHRRAGGKHAPDQGEGEGEGEAAAHHIISAANGALAGV